MLEKHRLLEPTFRAKKPTYASSGSVPIQSTHREGPVAAFSVPQRYNVSPQI